MSMSKEQYKAALKNSAKKKARKSKYNNKITRVGDLIFHSKKEADHFIYLKSLLDAGKISDLILQPTFDIAQSVYLDGRKCSVRKYKADFSYIDSDGNLIVEDVKGFKTAMYKLKRHLVKEIHGIEVVEI